VAGVALGDMYLHFAWQAWRLWHWAGSGGALGSQLTPWTPRLLAWQAWHLVTWIVLLCLSFLPRHNFCTHAHARTHARTHTLADETEEAILALLQAANVEKR